MADRTMADWTLTDWKLTDADSQHASRLQKLIAYVNRQWITKRSIGPERLSVRDNRS